MRGPSLHSPLTCRREIGRCRGDGFSDRRRRCGRAPAFFETGIGVRQVGTVWHGSMIPCVCVRKCVRVCGYRGWVRTSVAGKNEAGILNSRSRPEASFSRGRIAVNLCEATRRVIRFSYKGLIGTIRCSVFRKFRCFFLLLFFGYLRGSVDRGSIVVFGLYIGDRRYGMLECKIAVYFIGVTAVSFKAPSGIPMFPFFSFLNEV